MLNIYGIKSGWIDADLILNVAVLLGVFTFIILNVLLYKSEKRKPLLKKQAIDNNTVMKAKLVKQWKIYNDSESEYHGIYKYVVNGKKREYRVISVNHLPNMIDLYPENKSMTRFFSDYGDTTRAAVGFNGLVGIAVFILILWASRQILL